NHRLSLTEWPIRDSWPPEPSGCSEGSLQWKTIRASEQGAEDQRNRLQTTKNIQEQAYLESNVVKATFCVPQSCHNSNHNICLLFDTVCLFREMSNRGEWHHEYHQVAQFNRNRFGAGNSRCQRCAKNARC